MPSLESIIGLPGFELEKVRATKTIEVAAKCRLRPPCLHCGHVKCRIKSSFVRSLKHTRQGNRLMILQVRSHKFHCPKCERFFNLRIPGVLPRRRSTENFRLEVYERHHGGVSQRLISKTHGIGEATVERWYQDFVAYRVKELSHRHSPRALGIDEHFFTRKKGYATTLCDLGNHKIHDVILGRSEPSLKASLLKLRERERTRIVVMDLSETYRQIAEKYFPNALIVADRFHVIRLVNHHFLKSWQSIDPVGRKNRGLLSLMRRHEKNLSKEQTQTLGRYLSGHAALKEIYSFKQRLCALLCLRQIKRRQTLKHVVRELHDRIEALKEIPFEHLKTLGKTLDRWKVEIARMLRFSKSNGITEGFHNKMEMISRRAFGFRNFQNYRLRVLAHCGWDGVFTRF